MSPRIDSYLTLCLHEAAKSPLHYRHGCIIVRGGKVIGQGYNDYRRGFDGGSLKTGRLASAGALNAVLALKQKKASKAKVEHERLAHSVGGGRLANTPLSMHSEMMAIHSALSLSSTLSSSGSGRAASLLQKPYSKLQGRGKRQLRLRGLEAYVNFVCGQEQAAGEGIVAHGKVESTKQHVKEKKEANEQKDEEKKGRAPLKDSAEKDRKKKPCGNRHSISCHQQHHYRHHGVAPLQQQQQEQQKEQQRRTPKFRDDQHEIDLADRTKSSRPAGHSICNGGRLSGLSESQHGSRGNRKHVRSAPAALLPQSQTRSNSRAVVDRKRDSRLQGSDLYVARLGWGSRVQRADDITLQVPRQESETLPTVGLSTDTGDRHVSAHSLHDELRNPNPRSQDHALGEPTTSSVQSPVIGTSRPCYRCISMASSVGIRRMFWTNAKGEWDGGKVRDLVDALELAGASEASDGSECGLSGGAAGNGIFVTKHEVLMLRRMMGP